MNLSEEQRKVLDNLTIDTYTKASPIEIMDISKQSNLGKPSLHYMITISKECKVVVDHVIARAISNIEETLIVQRLSTTNFSRDTVKVENRLVIMYSGDVSDTIILID